MEQELVVPMKKFASQVMGMYTVETLVTEQPVLEEVSLKKISDFGQIKDGKFTPFESEG